MPTKLFNLEEAVEIWAWKVYSQTASKKQKKLREKQLKKKTPYIGLKIDWSGVKFKDETSWAPLIEEKSSKSEAGASLVDVTTQTTDASLMPPLIEEKSSESEAGGSLVDTTQTTDLPPKSSTTPMLAFFETKFHNYTKDDQEYTMRVERTTRSTTETSLEQGFTRGYEMSVTLKSPGEILAFGAGYHKEETLTKTEGQTFEEEMTWGVDTLIKVKQGCMAEASLEIEEKKFSGDYVIKTQVWGNVFVSFTYLRENNAEFKATGHDISEVIKSYLKTQPYDFVEIDDSQHVVTITTKGKCTFQFGIKQEVKVQETPLPKKICSNQTPLDSQ